VWAPTELLHLRRLKVTHLASGRVGSARPAESAPSSDRWRSVRRRRAWSSSGWRSGGCTASSSSRSGDQPADGPSSNDGAAGAGGGGAARSSRTGTGSKLDPFRDWICKRCADPATASQRLRELATELGMRAARRSVLTLDARFDPRFVAPRTFQPRIYRPERWWSAICGEPRGGAGREGANPAGRGNSIVSPAVGASSESRPGGHPFPGDG
jgi:hypothetical protein